MKNYEKPMAMANSELAEGVFMASGDASTAESDCWTVSAKSVQDWNGSHHVFEVSAVHSSSVAHISTCTVVTVTFSSPLTDAYGEFTDTFSGNTLVVTRELHANGYYSGDNYTMKVWAKAADEATTKALAITNISISGTKATNVQGVLD